jgi:hypothetical protein
MRIELAAQKVGLIAGLRAAELSPILVSRTKA